MGIIKCGKYSIETSNEDKILFAPTKITKGDLIQYYYQIAPIMLPYVKNRPMTMLRYPHGIKQEGFYQKDIPDYFPSWIKRVTIAKHEGGSTDYVVCNNSATLVYLANQACITPHLWLSKIDKLDYPDRMIFDIDPPRNNFEMVRTTALLLKEVLEELGLVSFVMTTGSAGLHVVVPLKRRDTFDTVRAFARDVAEILVHNYPKKYTLEMRIEKRKNRVFLDVLRNAFAQTGVAPYAVRPKPGAPVATPITWKEVKDPALTSQRYTINNVFTRLKKHGDPWVTMMQSACSLKSARKILDTL